MNPPLTRCLRWLGALWLPAALALGLCAQDAEPVLLSRTGGGVKTWGNLAELKADAFRGNPAACAHLGELLLNGDGAPQDIPRALALLEQAARAGVGAAAFRLGMVLDDGRGVAQDRRRALDYFRAAAAGGVAEAFFNVGAAYAGAHGVKRNYTEGLAWLILAAKRGEGGEAEQTVRTRIEKLRHPEWIAAAEARASAIEEELAAQTVASLLPPPAPFVFNNTQPPAAPADSVPASAPPAGRPVKVALPTGRYFSWPGFAALERAADRGEPGAPAALGQLLLAGKLTPADPLRAVNVLERAAQAGSADAAQLLAEIYASGEHLLRDDAKAFAYTLQAAHGGVLRAMFNTGARYANGLGTARDATAALTWLVIAKHFGLDQEVAEQRLRAQLQRNAPAEIAVAETRARALERKIEAAAARPDRP